MHNIPLKRKAGSKYKVLGSYICSWGQLEIAAATEVAGVCGLWQLLIFCTCLYILLVYLGSILERFLKPVRIFQKKVWQAGGMQAWFWSAEKEEVVVLAKGRAQF